MPPPTIAPQMPVARTACRATWERVSDQAETGRQGGGARAPLDDPRDDEDECVGRDRRVMPSMGSAAVDEAVNDAPAGNPLQVLLWSTGRAEFSGHPRTSSNWAVNAAID